jgi:hypothetical protein
MTDEKDEDVQNASAPNLEDAFEAEDDDHEEVGETAKTPELKDEAQGEDKDETVDEAEESEDEAEPPAAEGKNEGKSVPVAALKSERAKRQALEAELNDLKTKHAPQEEHGELDVDGKLFAERTNMSREMMMELKPDYQDMETIFTEIAKDNPYLVSQMMKSHNPAKFAYEKAKEHVEVQEAKKLKDSEEYKEFLKLKASGKTKVVTESPDEKRKKSVLAVPKLNKAASIGSNSTPKESLEDLDDMFEE